MYLHIPYRCKVGQPDALQHNGMTNSEIEMRKWMLGVLKSTVHGSCFP